MGRKNRNAHDDNDGSAAVDPAVEGARIAEIKSIRDQYSGRVDRCAELANQAIQSGSSPDEFLEKVTSLAK